MYLIRFYEVALRYAMFNKETCKNSRT